MHTSRRYNESRNQNKRGQHPAPTHCALDHARAIARSRPDNKSGQKAITYKNCSALYSAEFFVCNLQSNLI